MDAENCKFKLEIRFSKNVAYPQYGYEAYSIEGHSIYIPYGNKYDFKSSKQAIEFVKNKLDDKALQHFDAVSITNWRGYRGNCEYLKDHKEKNDTKPLNIPFAENLLSL